VSNDSISPWRGVNLEQRALLVAQVRVEQRAAAFTAHRLPSMRQYSRSADEIATSRVALWVYTQECVDVARSPIRKLALA
jgi:hypothetical protein